MALTNGSIVWQDRDIGQLHSTIASGYPILCNNLVIKRCQINHGLSRQYNAGANDNLQFIQLGRNLEEAFGPAGLKRDCTTPPGGA
jgi:hypothetical protein